MVYSLVLSDSENTHVFSQTFMWFVAGSCLIIEVSPTASTFNFSPPAKELCKFAEDDEIDSGLASWLLTSAK